MNESVKVGENTKSPIQAGLVASNIFAFIAQCKERRRQTAAQNRERITGIYGELSDSDIVEIVSAEKLLAQCEHCTGEPCERARYSSRQPLIEIIGGVAKISWHECETARAYRRRQRQARRIKNAKFPERYIGKTLADYQVDENNRVAVTFARNALKTRRGAFFFGERGTGKTYLAAIIAQEYLAADKSVIFIKVPRLLDEFYSVIRGQSEVSEQDILQELYKVDLLVLDDLGMEKLTRYAGAMLCKIIDARYDGENLTTLITSNYSLKEIQGEFDNASDGQNYNGSRLVDRCREICKPILFKGQSRRR